MKNSINRGELIAGLSVVVLGIATMVIASSYPLGTITRMGPGYAPIALGVVLVALGIGICLESRNAEREEIGFSWQPFFFILGGVLVWALTVARFGLIPATLALALCCAYVEKGRTWKTVLGTAVALCLIGELVFIRGLNLPLVAIRF